MTESRGGTMKPKQPSVAVQLAELLARMNRESGFPISVLTDQQGLAIASAADKGSDPERQSAVVALVQRAAVQGSQKLGMAETDEISLFDANGQRLVCRPFRVEGFELILAVMASNKTQSHRRATNHTIAEIRRVWKSFRE